MRRWGVVVAVVECSGSLWAGAGLRRGDLSRVGHLPVVGEVVRREHDLERPALLSRYRLRLGRPLPGGVPDQRGALPERGDEPGQPCPSCQPRVSTTRWTNLSTGTALAGTRAVVSDFGDATQGPLGDSGASGVAVEPSGQILVVDYDGGPNRMGALFRVDPVTGVRTLLSDFGNPTQGQVGEEPTGVAVEASGQILDADNDAGTNGMLFRVNPATGARTVLSDFSDGGKGPLGSYPYGVAVEASGKILVADQDAAGPAYLGALFRVDPVTGFRTLLSDFGNLAQGPLGVDPAGVAVETNGKILVMDSSQHLLFRVDPTTGVRTPLSDFGESAQGLGGQYGCVLAVEASGRILVVVNQADTGGLALFRVDPVTGARTVLSDFEDATQGPQARQSYGVAVGACGQILVSNDIDGTNGEGYCSGSPRERPRRGSRWRPAHSTCSRTGCRCGRSGSSTCGARTRSSSPLDHASSVISAKLGGRGSKLAAGHLIGRTQTGPSTTTACEKLSPGHRDDCDLGGAWDWTVYEVDGIAPSRTYSDVEQETQFESAIRGLPIPVFESSTRSAVRREASTRRGGAGKRVDLARPEGRNPKEVESPPTKGAPRRTWHAPSPSGMGSRRA